MGEACSIVPVFLTLERCYYDRIVLDLKILFSVERTSYVTVRYVHAVMENAHSSISRNILFRLSFHLLGDFHLINSTLEPKDARLSKL